MSTILPEQMNAMFARTAGSREQLDKVADAVSLYVQQRLRETAIFRQILKPLSVTPADLQLDTSTAGALPRLQKIDWLEPDSYAMSINFRGRPSYHWVKADYYTIPFHTISSQVISINEPDLRVYGFPILKVIENNTVLDMQAQEDEYIAMQVKIALFNSTRTWYNELVRRGDISGVTTRNFSSTANFMRYLFQQAPGSGAWSPLSSTNLNRADGRYTNLILSEEEQFTLKVVSQLQQICTDRELPSATLLLHKHDFDALVSLPTGEVGLQTKDELTRDGWTMKKIGGMSFITTIRDNPNIVRPGQIFIFPPPEFLGKFMILQPTTIEVDKKFRQIEMWAYTDIGAGFGNIMGIGCVLLRNAFIDLPIYLQNGSGTISSQGTFRVINDYTQTTLPSVV